MGTGVRLKLVCLSVAVLVVVSFGFTALSLSFTRGWVEEELKERAISFAREVAATIGDRRELESPEMLRAQIREILEIRRNIGQLDILVWSGGGSAVIATSRPERRLPFTRKDVARAQVGEVVSHYVESGRDRSWEVMAPVVLAGTPVGAVAAQFSLDRADRLAARTRWWAFGLTAGSVVVMALLMSAAIHHVVDRPVQHFVDAIARIGAGDTSVSVPVEGRDEFAVMARHFNGMITRIHQFNDELQLRVTEAVAELDQRYHEVQRLNEQLFDMQRRLSHAERLAISGRIMAEVAHEVGTPLHSVAGHLELLRRSLPAGAGPDALRRLTVIETELGRVTEIITQLLNLTRRSAGPPAAVDVNRLLRDTVELVRPGVSAAALSLAVETAPDLPRVLGHASQLQQVILNLLTNAIDATPPGGHIAASTRFRAETATIVLEVRDTGEGIAPERRRQIFEPFFSTKEPGRGTGLGLFISSQIVRDHKGRIELESEPGKGSAFRITLAASASA